MFIDFVADIYLSETSKQTALLQQQRSNHKKTRKSERKKNRNSVSISIYVYMYDEIDYKNSCREKAEPPTMAIRVRTLLTSMRIEKKNLLSTK